MARRKNHPKKNVGSRNRKPTVRRCRVCKCSDDDCRQCVAKTGMPCYWIAADLCSACDQSANQGAQ